MNKKLLVSAMGLALAGGMSLANADVQLYGQIDMSIDATDVDGGRDDVNMGSNRSAIGFKGSEDLGGFKAIFKSEWQVDTDDAGTAPGTNEDDTTEGGDSDGWKARDQYLGVQSDSLGRLIFGMVSTAYKSPGSKIDPWYRTRLQSRNVGLQSSLHKGRGEEGQGRATNTVRYDSPNWNGLGFTGTYTFDNNETDGPPGGEDDDPWSVGLTYKGMGAYLFASYMTTQRGDDDEVYQVGGKYSIAGFTVRGIYEFDKGLITSTGTSMDDGADIWSVGVDYKIANNLITLDYGQGDDNNGVDGIANNADDTAEYDVWRVGAQHMFSKRTKVYLGYTNQDFDSTATSNGGETEIVSLGMRHNF